MNKLLIIFILTGVSILTFFHLFIKEKNEELMYSFVVLGCNRVDKNDVNENNPSTANLEQLNRTFDDILKLPTLPTYLFLAGDLVMGYTDTTSLENELNAWKMNYENSPLNKTNIQLIAIPGNHEMMPGKNQSSTESAERTWLRVMKNFIKNNNGPNKNEDDSLQTNQSQLTYSFSHLNTHFIILNTDPVGKDWRVPYQWIRKDLNELPKNTKHIFAIGHKPAYSFEEEDGLVNYKAERDSFWNIMENANAKAMFAAHNHLYFCIQPHKNKTWQIIAGNGGSLLSDNLKNEKDKFFGFTLVKVFKNNKIIVESYGRDIPKEGYLSSPKNNETTIRDIFEINVE